MAQIQFSLRKKIKIGRLEHLLTRHFYHTPLQTKSRFRPGVSCVNQLLTITHETYKSFDDGLEVEGVFLNVSKTFDKVWHLGLLLRLLTSRVIFKWYLWKLSWKKFLYCCKQRVVLNRQHSSWKNDPGW